MPTTLFFEGPGKYLVPEPATQPELVVVRGGTFETDRPDEHLTSPHYDCAQIGDDSPQEALVKANTRDKLNALAREAGVENPESLPNKAAVAEAIVAAQASPNESAAEGEGPESASTKED